MPSPYAGKVYSFDHNWNDPVIERLSWLTNLLPKRSGLEQRIKVRQQPRRVFEYTALIGGEDEIDMRRRFDALFWGGQSEEILVPFWPDATDLSADLTAGASGLNTLPKLDGYDIDNQDCWLIFWQDYKTFEVVKISGIIDRGSPGNVSFETDTLNDWPEGTTVVPARLCLHDPVMNAEVWASDIQGPKVRFEVITPTTRATQGYRSTTPTTDTYRSTDVLADPGMNGDNSRTLERTLHRIDFQVGQWSNDSFQAAPFGGLDCKVSLEGKLEIADFLGWLNIRSGRQKAFWMPTWEKDFEPVERTGDDTFTADTFGYTANYALAESRRDIAFIRTDESMIYRRIIDSDDDGTTETFQVDTDLPDPLPPLDRVSFLRYCRLDQDEIELSWTTTEDVSASLRLRELIKTA